MVRNLDIQVGTTKTTLTIHEPNDVYDPTTGRAMTGSWLWGSSLILSHFLTQSTFTLHNKTVLELGSGTGLPGLTASQLGAHRVILTDLEPLLPGLRYNVEANGVGDRVEVCELVWGSDGLPSRLSGVRGRVDVVLMSDVFYEVGMMEGLGKTLGMVCGEETVVVAASEVRGSMVECFVELGRFGFEVSELKREVCLDGLWGGGEGVCGGDEEYGVYQISRSRVGSKA